MPLFDRTPDINAAIAAKMSGSIPKTETPGGNAGSSGLIPDALHQHPRITSADTVAIVTGNTVNIVFTRTFDKQPAMDFNLIEAPSTNQQPCLFAVVDWLGADGVTSLGTNPADGVVIGGCTAKAWRATPIPQNLVSLLVGAVFSIFGGTVTGIRFSYIAVASSRT